MDCLCKSNVETDFITLHYVTFIEPLAIFPTEVMSFDFEKFMNNSINEVIEAKTNDSFLLLDSSAQFGCTKKFEVQFENISHEVLEFFLES
jgi:hypothetical protein